MSNILWQDREKKLVEHLFYLAGRAENPRSWARDQILTQIKDALSLSREHYASDGVLEVLFRMAATAGKKIKTEVPLAHGNPSVIHQALSSLREQGYDVQGKNLYGDRGRRNGKGRGADS